MRCLSCGAEMHVARVEQDQSRVEQDQSMKVAGYEHQTWECQSKDGAATCRDARVEEKYLPKFDATYGPDSSRALT